MHAEDSKMHAGDANALHTKMHAGDANALYTKMHAGDENALYTKMHAGDANALCMSEIPRCIPVTLSCILKIPRYFHNYQNAYWRYQGMLDVPRDAC